MPVSQAPTAPPPPAAPPVPLVLQAHAVSKAFGGRAVLDRVSLAVGAGALHGLLGPNGAGKSTLMRIALGLVRADSGGITVLGEPAASGRAGVAGFVERPSFWPYLTVRNTLRLLADFDAAAADGVDRLLELVGLAGSADAKVGSLSVGTRQRLGLAAALQREPRVLVLDEPSTGLDPAGIRDLHAVLRDLAAAGVGVLMASHLMPEVDALCTHATLLRAGRVVFTGGVDELRGLAPDPAARLRTSDDERALAVSNGRLTRDPDGLVARGDHERVDALVLDLAAAGIAVRELTALGSPLGELFLRLTGPDAERPAAEPAT